MFQIPWQAIEAVGVVGAFLLAALAYAHQVEQSKAALWRDLAKEFDHEFVPARARCAISFKKATVTKTLAKQDFQGIMDFFETVAFLIEKEQIDPELAEDTWSYYFGGYYMASKRLMSTDPGYWQRCKRLAERWQVEREFPKPVDLEIFFDEEARFCHLADPPASD